jgi:hypothetical protein
MLRLYILLLTILIIGIVYTYKSKENYVPVQLPLSQWENVPKPVDLFIQTPQQYRFALDTRKLEPNQDFYTANEQIMGSQNPKTLEPPVIIAPPAATDYWMENQNVPSNINTSTNIELYQSGYVGTSECGQRKLEFPRKAESTIQQKNVWDAPIEKVKLATDQAIDYTDTSGMGNCSSCSSDIKGVDPVYKIGPNSGPSSSVSRNVTENYLDPNSYDNAQYQYSTPENQTSHVTFLDPNSNRLHLKSNIPMKAPISKCSAKLAEYNKDLNTQILDPDTYFARPEIVEPAISNLGISETLQFPPLYQKQDKDHVTWIEADPAVGFETEPALKIEEPTNSNIYDPRSFGYGTAYREYFDPLTGQPRYFYDDIEAVRQPKFIQRSEIDDASWANTEMSIDLSREMAYKKFITDTQQQREELQERAMRKYNAQVGWQRRLAPISNNQSCMNRIV